MPDRLERELDFDISPGLRALEELDSRLTAIVEGFGAQLSAAVTESLASLASFEIPPPDATPVSTAIEAAIVEGADVEPVVVITADAATVTPDIDAAVDAADPNVVVNADASAVAPVIEDALAEVDPNLDVTATVEVTADTTAAAAEIGGLEDQIITITAEADVADAAAQVDELGATATEAAGSIGGLSTSTTFFAGAASTAVGNADGLDRAFSGLGARSQLAVSGVAALGAFIAATAKNATDAESAELRFNDALGDTADRVRSIDVGGLTGDLSALAVTAGSSDEAMQLAAARIAELGTSSGAAGPVIGDTAERILALGLSLSVTNPALGEAGTVADALTNALAKGGRSLAQYGISLSIAQIETRALQDTSKASAEDLSIFDRAAAGAALATEQLGTSLGEKFQSGAETAGVQFASLRVRLDELLESLGAPLLAPILDVLEAATPIAEAFAQIMAELAEAVLPILPPALQLVVGPLQIIAEVLDSIPTPMLTAAAAFIAGYKAVTLLETGLSALSKTSVSLGPLALIAGAVAAVSVAVDAFSGSGNEAAKEANAFRTELFGAATSAGDLATRVDELDAKIVELFTNIRTEGDFGDQVAQQLEKMGVTAADLRDVIRLSDADFATYTAALEDQAKALGLSSDTAEVAQDVLEGVRTKTQTAAEASLNLAVQTDAVTVSQRESAVAANRAADGTVDYVAALDDASAAAVRQQAAQEATALANLEASRSWADLRISVLAGTTTLDDAAGIAERFGVGADAITGAIEAINAELDDFVSNMAGKLPTSSDAFSAWQEGIKTAFENVADASEDGGEAFDIAMVRMVQAADPAALVEQLKLRVFAIGGFQNSLRTLLDQGFTELVQFLGEQGPEIGGAVAATLVNDPANALALEEQLRHLRGQASSIVDFWANDGGPRILAATGAAATAASVGFTDKFNIAGSLGVELSDAENETRRGKLGLSNETASLATDSTTVFRTNFDVEGAARTGIEGAGTAVEQGAGGVTVPAGRAGKDAGDAFGVGFTPDEHIHGAFAAIGVATDLEAIVLMSNARIAGAKVGGEFAEGIRLAIVAGTTGVTRAAAALGAAASTAVRTALGIHSPSQVMYQLGLETAQGFASGMDAGVTAVAKSSDALAVAAVPSVSTPGSLISHATTSSSTVATSTQITFDVTVNLPAGATAGQMQEAGARIVKGADRELARRGVIAQVRAG